LQCLSVYSTKRRKCLLKPASYYKLLPALFGVLGFLFGLGCYLAENGPLKSNNHFFYWSIFFTLQTAVGIVIGFLIKHLYYTAFTDGLTGLWNFRFFYENLRRQLTRPTASCSLIYLDLDNFKCINDTNGHQSGDEALRQLAAILRQHCRTTDIVARLGGDEFAILLPDASLDGALVVAERIRQEAEIQFAPYHATISAGVAVNWPEANADRLMSLADQALYRAKNGKNQVIHLTPADSAFACKFAQ